MEQPVGIDYLTVEKKKLDEAIERGEEYYPDFEKLKEEYDAIQEFDSETIRKLSNVYAKQIKEKLSKQDNWGNEIQNSKNYLIDFGNTLNGKVATQNYYPVDLKELSRHWDTIFNSNNEDLKKKFLEYEFVSESDKIEKTKTGIHNYIKSLHSEFENKIPEEIYKGDFVCELWFNPKANGTPTTGVEYFQIGSNGTVQEMEEFNQKLDDKIKLGQHRKVNANFIHTAEKYLESLDTHEWLSSALNKPKDVSFYTIVAKMPMPERKTTYVPQDWVLQKQ